MTNYEAIMKMNAAQLNELFVEIYFTGTNNGQYAAAALGKEEEDERFEVMEENPFNLKWLNSEADQMLIETLENGNKEEYYTSNYCASLFRLMNINNLEEKEEEGEN
jgi:hypothetical protein